LSDEEAKEEDSRSWALKQAVGRFAHLFLFSIFFLLCDVESFFQERAFMKIECFFRFFSKELFSALRTEFSLCVSRTLVMVSFEAFDKLFKLCELS